jgi:hypothetical protein
MDKIPTLFLRDPKNMQLVTREVNPDAAWVLEGHGTPTVKKDGTNIRVTIENGQCTHVEKRRNPTRTEKAEGAEPGYVDASRNDPSDKHIFAAVDAHHFINWPEGAWSCEALGPKIQGGVESNVPYLYPFSIVPEYILIAGLCTFESIREYLEDHDIEGIVWHDRVHNRFAKIKRRDFGLQWPVKRDPSI